ncbi:MAG: GTP-binding protein, partial [Deltaproteobacteria bacterium]|nr:GTP-binding protein [Deltaproteobacteria bacterium]
MNDRDQINIVIVGHVDHGKSTVIGRLLADTGSLPEGKLEDVKALCARTAKPFEYAFLLDALKDERSQGITIDSARCFFKTSKRDYIVIDAPGHIEFLKNMVTGAAHAEAALLVIAADEGIQENSKRHGYLVSMLGVRQVVVLLNKMDLVGYDRQAYDALCAEYAAFLEGLQVQPLAFIPISARDGDNLVTPSPEMSWYEGPTVLQQLDVFEKKSGDVHLPLRFPVQDIYKFTEENDDRRILAGTLETGRLNVGDDVVFLPSHKKAHVRTIESFNTPVKTEASAGEAIGITLNTQLYIKPGEIITRLG